MATNWHDGTGPLAKEMASIARSLVTAQNTMDQSGDWMIMPKAVVGIVHELIPQERPDSEERQQRLILLLTSLCRISNRSFAAVEGAMGFPTSQGHGLKFVFDNLDEFGTTI